jgi:SAM-dependent methyltransferase
MIQKTHRPTTDCFWDTVNDNRMGRYLTATEVEYIRTALLGVETGRALDMGCATGKLSFPLMNMGFDVVGADYDFRALQEFLRQDAKARLVNANAEKPPFAATSFNCIVAVQIIDYLSNRPDFYRGAWHTLQPGGLLLVTLTNKHSVKGIIYGLYLRLVGRRRVRRYYEMGYAAAMAEVAAVGFEIVNAWGYNWNLLPRDADSMLVPLFAFVERIFGLKRYPALAPLVFVVARKAD